MAVMPGLEAVRQLWDPLFLLVPVYMVGVYVLRQMYPPLSREQHAANRAKQPKKKPFFEVMLAYNALMSVFSLACFLGMSWVVIVRQNMVIKGPDCMRYARDPLFRLIVDAFHYSKYIEFADTFFLIMQRKDVSWLHFFHHCGACINVGILARSGIEAAFLFVTLNGFVHTIMYAYYGLALVGIRFKAKSLITIMQIVQFFTGFGSFYTYKNIPCFGSSQALMGVYVYTYSYVGVVLLFFVNFFIQNYCKGKKAKNASNGKHTYGREEAVKKLD
uniref:Elongation of fatty acids protein n=1 Tax=Lotharella globosa TaxID=91324 RepID=A0A6V3R5E0_9EUKA